MSSFIFQKISSIKMYYLHGERVLIIGYSVKDLKPLKSLISVSALIKLTWLMNTIGQITTVARESGLANKSIQQLPSVKYYSKILSNDQDLKKLSFIQALGLVLPAYKSILIDSQYEEERIFFIHERIVDFISRRSNLYAFGGSSEFFLDKNSFESYLAMLALRVRNQTQAFPIYKTTSLSFKTNVLEVDLELILDSVVMFAHRIGITNVYSRLYMEFILKNCATPCLGSNKAVTKQVLLVCITLFIKDLLLNFDSSRALTKINFCDTIFLKNGEKLVLLEQLVNESLFLDRVVKKI